jgi:septal ring factor EnvC (AmiA/AmiB activator)
MTPIATSSGRKPPTGLHSAADLVSATRKAILVAAVALVIAIAAIAAAAAPLLSSQLRGADDPAVPSARDLAKRLDQISAELDRLRQSMQQRESARADLADQQKRLSDGLAALTQETADIRARLARDLTALRSQLDATHPQTEEAEKPAPEERRSRRGRRGRRSMSFTIPNR